MVYKRVSCQFLFENKKVPESCPDCGKHFIVKGSKEDIAELERYKKEFGPRNK